MKFYRINLNENKSLEPEDLTIRKETKKKLRKLNVKGNKVVIDKETMEKSKKVKDQPGYYLDKEAKRWKRISRVYFNVEPKTIDVEAKPIGDAEKQIIKNYRPVINKVVAGMVGAGMLYLAKEKFLNKNKEPQVIKQVVYGQQKKWVNDLTGQYAGMREGMMSRAMAAAIASISATLALGIITGVLNKPQSGSTSEHLKKWMSNPRMSRGHYVYQKQSEV